MPNLNRKGPQGEGAMSGRKSGLCSPDNKGKTAEEIRAERAALGADQTSRGNGNGRGKGQARGMGRANCRQMGLGPFGKANGRGFGRAWY